MFIRKNPETEYDRQIRQLLKELETHKSTSEEYGTIVERLQKLQKMRVEDRPATISPDTRLNVAANLVGIALVIRHEHLNNITSKAFAIITKLR